MAKTEHDVKLERSISRSKRRNNMSMDLKDHIMPSYYMKSLNYHYSLPLNKLGDLTKKYKEHFVQSLASIRYLKKIRMPSMENVSKSRMQLAQLGSSHEKSMNVD